MFKFDFNIDEADDLDGALDLGISSTSRIQPLPVDKPKLEPFAEILIDHLVRATDLFKSIILRLIDMICLCNAFTS